MRNCTNCKYFYIGCSRSEFEDEFACAYCIYHVSNIDKEYYNQPCDNWILKEEE